MADGLTFERVADPAVQLNLDRIAAALGVLAQVDVRIGTGDPNGVIEASPPALYLNYAGGAGTTLYVKESGTQTSTGWIGK